MRKTFLICTALFSLCSFAEENQNLIIFYDSRIGNQPLLSEVKNQQLPILYQYQSFNAIAISVPQDKNLEQTMQKLKKVKGVLQVNKDEKAQLH